MNDTLASLHRATQIVGALRKSRIPPQPNALHLSLYVTASGLTTGILPEGDSVYLHFADAVIEHRDTQGNRHPITFSGQTPKTVCEALGIATPEIEQESFAVVADEAADYAYLLYSIYTAMSRFRARLSGMMTPLVVWTHHFDLSFLWFRGNTLDEHTQPHINFGFAPFSEGFDQPYVYVYGWSQLGYLTIEPPYPARMHRETFTGAIIDYAELRRYVDREAMLERVLDDIYRQFAPFL